jgi:hypothetical protein
MKRKSIFSGISYRFANLFTGTQPEIEKLRAKVTAGAVLLSGGTYVAADPKLGFWVLVVSGAVGFLLGGVVVEKESA